MGSYGDCGALEIYPAGACNSTCKLHQQLKTESGDDKNVHSVARASSDCWQKYRTSGNSISQISCARMILRGLLSITFIQSTTTGESTWKLLR